MTTHTIIAHRLLALGFDNNKVGTILSLNFQELIDYGTPLEESEAEIIFCNI